LATNDVTPTAANVESGAGATITPYTAGLALTVGLVVYLKSADSRVYLADADAGDEESKVLGIVQTPSSAAGDNVNIQTAGRIKIGGTALTKGMIYILSNTAGKITECGDLASGYRASIVGVADDADWLILGINNSLVTMA
jgi:hypothetical protein